MLVLVTTEITIRWDKRTYKHYISLGYEFTRWNQELKVKVKHLTRGSNVKVEVMCDFCGQIVPKYFYNYIKSKKNELVNKDCCMKCRKYKTAETNLIKYGVDHQMKRKDIIKKTKKTNLKKYGVEFPLQSNEIIAKTKQTKISKYGIDNVLVVKEVKQKIEETNRAVYGVNYPLENEEIYAKTRETFKENYNTENLWESEELRKKARQTFITKFWGPSPFSSKHIRKKAQNTFYRKYGVNSVGEIPGIQKKIDLIMINKYGVATPIQNPNIKEKINKTNLKKYGVEFPLQSKEIREKAAHTMTINEKIPTSYQQIYLQKVLGGELNFLVFQYNLDIAFINYCKIFNVYVEYDGSGHDLKVKLGKQSIDEYSRSQKRRSARLKGAKWKEIRFVSTKDLIPSDKIIRMLFSEAIESFHNGSQKFIIDIDTSKIYTDDRVKDVDLGKLRKIKACDIQIDNGSIR